MVNRDYFDINKLKDKLWTQRYIVIKSRKSKDWTIEDLKKSLNRLKSKKSRDPHGLINELFKGDYIGQNLLYALLILFNNVKRQHFIPDFMKFSNITSIFKRKGSHEEMDNQRGIFSLTVFKKILDNLLFEEYYPKIDENMSDANIGGRQKRMSKDHLFLVYGIMNNVINGDEDSIEIQIYDIEKAFDKLWIQDCLNDLIDIMPEDMVNEKIGLLFKSNEVTKVAIKTPFGLSKRIDFETLVTQGGSWGPILCSNSVDSLGRKGLQQDKKAYLYKNRTKIPPLGFVDDVFGVSKCGIRAIELNAFITSQIEMKRLNFNVGTTTKKSKCKQLHVGKYSKDCCQLEARDRPLDQVTEVDYLGDIISFDAKNSKNIKDRVSKGMGIIGDIFSILETICFGPHYFEIALLLREALLINGTIYNSAAWYNLTPKDIRDIEQIDRVFFSRLFSTPKSTPFEAIFLECGVMNIGMYIKCRRVIYFHNLINRPRSQIIYSFLMSQYSEPIKGDWVIQVTNDFADLNISQDFEFLQSTSSSAFKNLVKRKARLFSLDQ